MNKRGRPRKFDNPKEMQDKIDRYFDLCDKEKKPYTITGLALTLDTTRKTLLDYENNYEKEYSDTVKKAKTKCENYAEEQLYRSSQVAGIIFNLKNNYYWKDQQEVKHEGNMEIKLEWEE